MNLYHFMAAVTWIATVTAALESDSHGNWSNEKIYPLKQSYEPEVISNQPAVVEAEEQNKRIFNASENYGKSLVESTTVASIDNNRREENIGGVVEPQRKYSKQIVQPYVLSFKSKTIKEEPLEQAESLDSVPQATIINQNVNNQTVTVEYIPSEEIPVSDSTTTARYIFHQENSSNDLSQILSDENLDIDSVGDFGQRVRSYRQRNRPRQSVENISNTEDNKKGYRKSLRSQATKKLNNSESNGNVQSKDKFPFALSKGTNQAGTKAEYENVLSVKDSPSSTPAPIISVSLGKFSGPIVVADLPRQKKYSYSVTSDHSETNEASKSTPLPVENVKSKVSENSYPAASPVILNPLQVGVALMNAGQDIKVVNEHITLTRSESNLSHAIENTNIEDLIQNDSPISTNTSYAGDQIVQQEQISEVVSSNSPTQSVEIQKSVEIFHTAPVQEIHYPVEFVPYVQPPSVKQQQLQEDYRKLSRTQYKEQRPSQVNVYKSNEIVDESVVSSGQDHGRYVYNVNENDVVVDQSQPVPRPAEVKLTFGAKEPIGATQYDQAAIKHSKTQGLGEYEPLKDSFSISAQSTRLIDSLSSLANLESPQSTQEASQILLSKSKDVPSDLRLLLPVPQSHAAENTLHVPHLVDVQEKKLPFPVEKVIEKQVTIPQPYPVHIPVDRVVEKQIRIPYPVHVEKVVEKKIPFAIQRFIIPLPIHFRIPQPIPVPVPVEKPVPIPVPVEKNLGRPYPIEIENGRPYSLDGSKLVKTGLIYNVYNDGNYQQQLIRQNFQAPLAPHYVGENELNHYNATGQYYGPGYLGLNRPLTRQPTIHTLPKKIVSYNIQYPHSINYPLSGNNGNYGRSPVDEEKVKDEYVGPVPRKQQNSLGVQTKILYSSPEIQSTLRRTRQELGNTGSFRQSKMEYGFKPPMVPSVQYDEQTASKVN